MEPSLQVDPKGIELILGLIRKTVPQAASAKADDFYDARFFTELRESGSKTAEEGKILKTQASRSKAGPLYGPASSTANEMLTGLQDLASQIGYFINLDDDS